ncbi:MAG: hypothetical protein BGO31_02705 [Bacteroidetes bacterium 43-16]|nr:MAG: hypothetical protein BGO31_02705 [Bacteroidetes bacterium 43-16]
MKVLKLGFIQIALLALGMQALYAQSVEKVHDITGYTINGDYYGSNPHSFVELNGKLYFIATEQQSGYEIWHTDGVNTEMMIDLAPGYDGLASNIYKLGDNIVFTARVTATGPGSIIQDTLAGVELYVSDGTVAGTRLLRDIFPGLNQYGNPNESNIDLEHGLLDTQANKLYFTAMDFLGNYGIWVTDGTDTGTYCIRPGLQSSYGYVSTTYLLGITGNKLYYVYQNASGQQELHVLDVASHSFHFLKNVDVLNNECIVKNGKLFFIHSAGPAANKEFWVSDGTAGGTLKLSDTIIPYLLTTTEYNGKYFFCANVPAANFNQVSLSSRMAYTDGTTGGTGFFENLFMGINVNEPIPVYNNRLYFCGADTSIIGGFVPLDIYAHFGLFESDGTTGGTTLLANNLSQANTGSRLYNFFEYKNKLYFKSYAQATTALYRITPQHSIELVNANFSSRYALKDQNDSMLINLDNDLITYERYTSGSFAAGKYELFDGDHVMQFLIPHHMNPHETLSSGPAKYYKYKGNYYFSGQYDNPQLSEETGYQLWRLKIVDDELSTDNINSKSIISLYPNPAQHELRVLADEKAQYSIFNMSGSELKKGLIIEGINNIDLKDLPSGTYTISVINKTNNRSGKKFIINK